MGIRLLGLNNPPLGMICGVLRVGKQASATPRNPARSLWIRQLKLAPDDSVEFRLTPACVFLIISISVSGCCSLETLRAPFETTTIRGQDPRASYDESLKIPQMQTPANNAGSPQLPPNVYLPLTLREAIESALVDSSVVRVLEGGVNVASITPNDVVIAATQIEVERGRFQPTLSAYFDGSNTDKPPNAFFGPGIALNTSRDTVDAYARISKPLSSGGTLSVGYEPSTAYLYFPNGVDPDEFNPIYSTDYVVRVKQPLLRNRGSEVTLAPIRIAQLRTNQSRWELEEVLNSQIRSLTEGYWNLYAAHLQLHAVQSILPIAEESVRIEDLRRQADRSILADVARARFQLDGFRRTQATMKGNVRTRVLQMRQLMNGQPDVEPLFLPSEKPNETPPPEDVPALVQVALENSPRLNRLREQLSQRNIELAVAQNQVLPALDFRGEYHLNGLESRLDSSMRQALTSDYTDWTLGVVMDVPIGNKTNRSRREIAELALARDRIRLNAIEQNISFEIAQLVSDLQLEWQRLQIAKQQAQETQEWLRVSRIRYTQPPAANTSQDWLLLALTDLQSAMRAYVDAISDVGNALADYNTVLAELNQAQGMSVFQWQQQQEPPQPRLPGGHSGFIVQDYRQDPSYTLQTYHAPAESRSPQQTLQMIPANGRHAFLQNQSSPNQSAASEDATPLMPPNSLHR